MEKLKGYGEDEEENEISHGNTGRCTSSSLEDVPFLAGHVHRPSKKQLALKVILTCCPKMNIPGVILLVFLVASSISLTVKYERGSSNAPIFRPQYCMLVATYYPLPSPLNWATVSLTLHDR